ncbi:MAG: HNH endonuclease signature motif containing protein, partial [Halieaceae bacterium]|nr:HNH endonuclease signature motif containing protein [Halieaceae bacterium]
TPTLHGSFLLNGELPEESARLVQKALEQCMARAVREQDPSAEDLEELENPSAKGMPVWDSEDPAAQRAAVVKQDQLQADALVDLSREYLAGGTGRKTSTADHYQVLVHVDEAALRGQPNTDSKSDLPIETVRRLCCDGSVIAVTESKESSVVKVRVPADAPDKANASRDAFELSPTTSADDATTDSTVDSPVSTRTDSACNPSHDAPAVSPVSSAGDAPAGSTVESQDSSLTDLAGNPSRDASASARATSADNAPAGATVDSHGKTLTDLAGNPSRDASGLTRATPADNAPANLTVDPHDKTLTDLGGNPSRDAFAIPPATAPNAETGRSRPSLNLSRKHRLVQPALRRALEARDRGCRYPGCSHERWLDAHHVVHWADGGETSLENTLLLCSSHHRLLHEGGFAIRADANGEWQFQNTKGMRRIPAGG